MSGFYVQGPPPHPPPQFYGSAGLPPRPGGPPPHGYHPRPHPPPSFHSPNGMPQFYLPPSGPPPQQQHHHHMNGESSRHAYPSTSAPQFVAPPPPPAPVVSPEPTPSTSKSTLYPSRPHPLPSYTSPRLLARSRPSNSSTAPGVTFRSSIPLPESIRQSFTLWQDDSEDSPIQQSSRSRSKPVETLQFGIVDEPSANAKGKGKEQADELEPSAQATSGEANESVNVATEPQSTSSVQSPAASADLSSAPAPVASTPPPSPPPAPPAAAPPPADPTPSVPSTPSVLSPVLASSSPAPVPISTSSPHSPVASRAPVAASVDGAEDASVAPSTPAPAAPAPPPVKKAPVSWAALLKPPPGVTPPPSAPSSVNGSAKAKAAGGPGNRVKPSSLAQLLSVGAAAGEGGPVMDTTARGLVNRGNLCFVNSILQVLVFTPGFYTLFKLLGDMLPADFAGEYPLVDAMILFLREFPASTSSASKPSAAQFPGPPSASSAPSSTGTSTPTGANGTAKTLGQALEDAFVPEGIYTALSHIPCFSFMRQGHQEDAEEFLGFFLNTLHEEVGALLTREQERTGTKSVNGAAGWAGDEAEKEGVRVAAAGTGGSSGGDDGWMEVGKKNKSSLLRTTESRPNSITHLFTGLLRSTLSLPSPAKPSITIEPFMPLQLDIQPAHVHSIESALVHLTSPEVIHGVTLPGGRGEGEASKRNELERTPRVLVLHLKRFGWDGSGMGKARKMGKAVGFGEELIVPQNAIAVTRRTSEPIKYKLFGVVYHHGPTVSSGHYTSAVLAQQTKTWLHVDDETVTTVDAKEVTVTEQAAKEGQPGDIGGRERCPYILFYERV